jgi:hypothetical protein
MTIHQPSWALLKLVDKVQLLAEGKVYYEGLPGDMSSWFDGLGYSVPEGANPADHYITIAENPEDNEKGRKRVQELIQAWTDRGTSREGAPARQPLEADAALESFRGWPTSWTAELGILMHRNIKQLVSMRSFWLYGTP